MPKFYNEVDFNNLELVNPKIYTKQEIEDLFDLTPEEVQVYSSLIDDLHYSQAKLYSSYHTEERLTENLNSAKSYADSLVASLNGLKKKVVTSTDSMTDENTLYLMLIDAENNIYQQYLLLGSPLKPVPIGTTEVNLSNYYTKTEVDKTLGDYPKKTEVVLDSEMQTTISKGTADNTHVPTSKAVVDYIDTLTPKTPQWETGKSYSVGDVVVNGSNNYECIVAHTSTTFEADVDKWIIVQDNYYTVTQAQYDSMVASGIITSDNKSLYLITDATETTKIETISLNGNDYNPDSNGKATLPNLIEKSSISTTISSSSTDTEVPSTKAVYTALNGLEGTTIVTKTYAEYQALSEDEKNDPSIIYDIPDYPDATTTSVTGSINSLSTNTEIPTAKAVFSDVKERIVGKEWIDKDLNDIDISGTFYCATTDNLTLHYPVVDNGWVESHIWSGDTYTDYRMQIFRSCSYSGVKGSYYRIMVNGTWEDWQEIYMGIKDGCVQRRGTVEDTDANNIVANGVYQVWATDDTTYINYPVSQPIGTLIVMNGSNFPVQIFKFYNGWSYIRSRGSQVTEWTDWAYLGGTRIPFTPTPSTGYTISDSVCYFEGTKFFITFRVNKTDGTAFSSGTTNIVSIPIITDGIVVCSCMLHGSAEWNKRGNAFIEGQNVSLVTAETDATAVHITAQGYYQTTLYK